MNKEITITKEVAPVITKANAMVIKNEEQLKEAVVLLSTLNKAVDKVTEEKEKITKPLNEALKAERARWKPMETIYEDAIASIRSKMTIYQTEQVKLQKEAEQRIANRIGAGKGKLSIDTAINKINSIKTPEKEIATSSGLVQFREKKCFEVMDITFLPIEYLLPNETMIREDMKTGKELPGVRYWIEQTPANFR